MPNRPPPPDMTPLASLAILLGVIMVLAGVTQSDRIPGWAADYGTALTILAIGAYLLVAGRVLHWGIGELLDPARSR
ncbi:hypothetical protein [Nocardia bovistercoris]|uniref:Uncharacterized protein n=1 Tax=Nocardia bovistercoris TaxID=2785916 RepID=A0A931N1E2_9NOCA|nr:hypothetical protein [Nocardia bovistercoris]MBH0774846.1 hypothetical protein [Nocardia bovistercoris]